MRKELPIVGSSFFKVWPIKSKFRQYRLITQTVNLFFSAKIAILEVD